MIVVIKGVATKGIRGDSVCPGVRVCCAGYAIPACIELYYPLRYCDCGHQRCSDKRYTLDTLLLYCISVLHCGGHQRCSDEGCTLDKLLVLYCMSVSRCGAVIVVINGVATKRIRGDSVLLRPARREVASKRKCCVAPLFCAIFLCPLSLLSSLYFVCVASAQVVPSGSTVTLRSAGSLCTLLYLYIHFCVHVTGVECDVQCEHVSERSGFGIY